MRWKLQSIIVLLIFSSCAELKEVTKSDFESFVKETGYVTEDERFGWTFEQFNVEPNGFVLTSKTFRDYERREVVQVSYNDAVAYCDYYGLRLPTEKQYWQMVNSDQRLDVWDWVEEGFALGGSYLCNERCTGGKGERLKVSKNTSNSHIGFCVINN